MVKKKFTGKKKTNFWIYGLFSFLAVIGLYFLAVSQTGFSVTGQDVYDVPGCTALYDCGVGCVGPSCFSGELSCDVVCSKFADCYVLFDDVDNDLACVVDDTQVAGDLVVFDGEVPVVEEFFGGSSDEN